MDSCSCVPKQRILDKTSYWRYITMLVWILLLFVDQCSSTPTNPSSLKALITSTLRPPENNLEPTRPLINAPNVARTTLDLPTTTATPYIVNKPKEGKNWRVENGLCQTMNQLFSSLCCYCCSQVLVYIIRLSYCFFLLKRERPCVCVAHCRLSLQNDF